MKKRAKQHLEIEFEGNCLSYPPNERYIQKTYIMNAALGFYVTDALLK